MNTIINALKDEIDNHLGNIPGYFFLKSASATLQVIKKRRAEEFLEIMSENEQRFVIELINNECFVSGLALTLRQVIEEYSLYKRHRIHSIFLGFTTFEDKESFELEKMYNVLNLVSITDLEVLNTCNDSEFINTTNHDLIDKNKFEALIALTSLGLFYSPTVFDGSNFDITDFGKKFKNFVFSS